MNMASAVKNRLQLYLVKGYDETHLSCTCWVSTFCNSPSTTVTSESSSRNLLRLFKYLSNNKSISKHENCLYYRPVKSRRYQWRQLLLLMSNQGTIGWLNKRFFSLLSSPHHRIIRRDRKQGAGGLLVYIRTTVVARRQTKMEPENIESICLNVKVLVTDHRTNAKYLTLFLRSQLLQIKC